MITRRHFLAFTAATGTHAVVNSLEAFARPLESERTNQGFRLLIFATNWGYTGTWEEFAAKIAHLGYDGAELWYPSEAEERKAIRSAFSKHRLRLGFLIGSGDRDYNKHFSKFKASLDAAVVEKPVYINCHSGRDYFTFEQNRKIIELTTEASKASGVPVYHETHRSRILYSAPVARQFMEALPQLRITFDVSHWCNVHESLLADQEETLLKTLDRVDHIHARIGHPEGPQVNDPRAPEWKQAVEAHFAWWDKVVQAKKRDGKQMTFLTEFGPIDYLPALPYTRQPVADQWEINKHMLDTLRARYS